MQLPHRKIHFYAHPHPPSRGRYGGTSPGPMASQARHESVSREETSASRYVVPRGEGETQSVVGQIARLQGRRRFLAQLGLGAAFFAIPGAFAAELVRTPAQTEGPFYPDHLPLDTDNDLLIVNNSITPAVGEVTYLSGCVLDARGEPLRNATVEIWQADAFGSYINSRDHHAKHDTNFQGFGRFLTGSTGEYLFRTIKPVPYSGRTPHIHFKVKRSGKELMTTQWYIKRFPQND